MRSFSRGFVMSMVASAAVLLSLTVCVSPARGLVLTAPKDTAGSIDVTITLGPGDPSGDVTLFEDGVPVARRAAVSTETTVAGLPLEAGAHELGAELRTVTGAIALAAPEQVYRWGTPTAPTWVDPSKATVASPCTVRVVAGASSASMTLAVNGALIKTVACRPGSAVSFGKVILRKGSSTFTVTSESLYGERAVFIRSAKRIEYPYATCIIVDKSEFRLYWVRNSQLVKVYRIAHGRGNRTPVATWRILAKYVSDPRGEYGPRKMRLYKRSGRPGHYSYTYTRYLIHGTNEPWAIGTMSSHGCVRMYNSDVLELYPQVPLGTMVITRA